ncbi:MAG: ABC transporter permease [Bacteroidota bacterium]
MMLLKIAWLNIWRNKRRTLITAASVFFAVLLAILVRSMTDGIYENMIRNFVSFSSGYVQIHQKGYWDEQSIDNTFEENKALNNTLLQNPDITHILPRLENFALASFADKTKGVLILGIDPELEEKVNSLDEKVIKGNYLESLNDEAILIGEGLASRFKLKVRDTLVLLGKGYQARSAAAKYEIKGIIQLGSPDLNNNIVYLPLQQAQYMHAAENRLTAITIVPNRVSQLNDLKTSVQKNIDTSRYEVMTWKEMIPELNQFIEADRTGHYIIILILYVIVSFGLFGTLLMMTFERIHEFGILIAIGMKKRSLAFILLMESLMITLIGCLAGIAAGVLLVQWFINNPIYFTGELKEVYENYGIEPYLYFSGNPKIFIVQTLIILILSGLLALYPVFKMMSLKPVKAINS